MAGEDLQGNSLYLKWPKTSKQEHLLHCAKNLLCLVISHPGTVLLYNDSFFFFGLCAGNCPKAFT